MTQANHGLFSLVRICFGHQMHAKILFSRKNSFIVKMDTFFDFEFTQEQLHVIDSLERSHCSTDHVISEGDEVINIPRTRKRRVILSDSEEDDRDLSPALSGHTPECEWYQPRGKQPRLIPFTEIPGLKPYSLRNQLANATPVDFYSLLVTDQLFENIAHQTNIFAQQSIDKGGIKDKSRLRLWTPTDKEEIKRFLGVIIWMGIVKLPKIVDYWSNDEMLGQSFAKKTMSRNRFEVLLRMLHFSNNEEVPKNDRLGKIRRLVEILNQTFSIHYTPDECLCVDESMIPFRGRIIFRQYNKSKRHKYGIKLFKLCTTPGYTTKVEVYGGKTLDSQDNTPTNVVLNLARNYFGKGHTMFVDNWYTSLDLAEKLVQHDTHLVGTLRKNRKNLPKDVMTGNLKPGEFMAKENKNGVTVMKWKDKRDVCLLSTKHSIGFTKKKNKRGVETIKPKIVIDYNKAKAAVDLSDQMSAYSSPLRKTLKWYKKLGIELLLNTAVVNARVLYESTTKKKISVVDFRRLLAKQLIEGSQENTGLTTPRPRRQKHELKKKEGAAVSTRKFCRDCYKSNVELHGRNVAKNKTKKVSWFCTICPGNPHLCRQCFDKCH